MKVRMRFVSFSSANIGLLGCYAKNVLKETGADHVVYGLRFGDKLLDTGCIPVNDEEFQRRFARRRYDMVYALHNTVV